MNQFTQSIVDLLMHHWPSARVSNHALVEIKISKPLRKLLSITQQTQIFTSIASDFKSVKGEKGEGGHLCKK